MQRHRRKPGNGGIGFVNQPEKCGENSQLCRAAASVALKKRVQLKYRRRQLVSA